MAMQFHPHQQTNAIVAASFACEFGPPLDEAVLKQIGSLHERFADRLPQKIEQPAVSFRILPGTRQPQAQQVIGAIAFSAFARDGRMVQQFNATPPVITYAEMEYTRWDNIWPAAKQMLEAVLEVVGDNPVQAFGLEYQDRFRAEQGPDEPIDVSPVLKRDTKYVVQRVFDLHDVWHSYHGSVAHEDRPYPHNVNDSVNIALLRRPDLPPPQLALEITLQHRHVLQEPKPAKEVRELLEKVFATMHQRDKEVMADLLTPEMAGRIKLME